MTYPIQRFLEQTPRMPLLAGPTPLHPMCAFRQAAGITALIKRDDMTGLGPGGNKARSLEFLLGDALSQDSGVVLTAGPAQSNLCVLTAAACARVMGSGLIAITLSVRCWQCPGRNIFAAPVTRSAPGSGPPLTPP